jgi:hypothetical protein
MQRDQGGSDIRDVQLTLDLRTSPQWNLSFGPRLIQVTDAAQFVGSVTDATAAETFGVRYIFAPLEQTELSLVTRLNYTFTPNLSLEIYAQPLISHAEYGTPKQFLTPGTFDFATFGVDRGTAVHEGTRWRLDPDGDGPAAAFRVPDRSFTTRSVRGNAVLRWEYRPGSTFFAVWQQERLNRDLMSHFEVNRALGTLLDGQARNVIVLKWSYWFNP